MVYKIGLVQTADINGGNIILPLSIGILWEYAMTDPANKKKWQLNQIVYKKDDVEQTAQSLSQCDLVAFSTYLWNSEYQFSVASRLKQLNPKCFIVFGGPNIYANIPDFWNDKSFIDLAIVGEGERAFASILKQWPNLNLDAIPGAWSKSHYAGSAERLTDLTVIPSPYLNGFFDPIVQEATQQGLMIQATVQTNRGCPYRCSFCEEGTEYKTKMYFYHFEQIKQQFEWCGKNKVEFLALADDNWGIAPRDLELMDYVCQVKLKYGYPRSLDATFAKNAPDRVLELAKIDQKYSTGLIRGVTSALQSKNPKTLESIKRFNLVDSKQHYLLSELKKLGTPIYAELIWPLPHETYNTLLSGIDQIVESELYTWIAVYPLSLIRSADLYDNFHQSYGWAEQQSTQSKSLFHVRESIPMSSDWADFDSVLRGHVFASWLAVMHFFGYGKLILDHLRKNHHKSVSQIIDAWITYLHSGNKNTVQEFSQRIQTHWANWLTYQHTDLVQEMPGYDTNFWHPYTYLAGFLQENYKEYQQLLKDFLLDYCSQDLSELVDLNFHSVVRYGQKYPYNTGTHLVELTHIPPNFDNFYEFCRYYFYWNRRKGLSITKIS